MKSIVKMVNGFRNGEKKPVNNINNIKISVIIPTYKSETYVINPLQSIVDQTINLNSIEVIVVDDVSPDNTISTVESYANKIPNLIIKKMDKNTGSPVIPRNTALSVARGKYVLFMDNDDKIGEETLERFYQTAEKFESDVIFGKYVGVNGRIVPKSQFNHGNLYHADFIKDNLVHSLAPHKMFRLDFLKKFKITFDSNIFVGEDQFFVMKAFVNANNISVLSDYDYYYVVNRKNESNLSEIQNTVHPSEIYQKVDYIMNAIDESGKSSVEKMNYKVAYLQRVLLTHPSKVFSKNSDVQNNFLKALKNSVTKYVTVEMRKLFKSQYIYMIDCINELDGKKLIDVRKQLMELDSNDVVYIEGNGVILAGIANEKLNYDNLFPVNWLNRVQSTVYGLKFGESNVCMDVELIQTLLTKFDNNLSIEFKNRNSGESFTLKPAHLINNQRAYFEIPYNLFQNIGIYDVFIKAKVKGNRKRKYVKKGEWDITLPKRVSNLEFKFESKQQLVVTRLI